MEAPVAKGAREMRAAKIETRASDTPDELIVEGYATTFDTAYDVAGGAPYGWSEVIAPGAFTKTLRERDDVRFLVNHEGVPAARTKSGTLSLVQDDLGLRVEARLDRTNPSVAELASALERGDLDQMSFAFQVVRQEWNDEYTARRILEAKLFDVAPVTFPANPATHIQQKRDAARVAEVRGFPLSLALAERDRLALVAH